MKENPPHIDVGYSKGPSFRTIRVDGAWGGVTPKRDIFMALWSERPSIPDRVRYEIVNDALGAEHPEFDSESGVRIMRDVEIGLSMDKATANVLIDWLKTKVFELESAEQKMKEGEEKPQAQQ